MKKSEFKVGDYVRLVNMPANRMGTLMSDPNSAGVFQFRYDIRLTDRPIDTFVSEDEIAHCTRLTDDEARAINSARKLIKQLVDDFEGRLSNAMWLDEGNLLKAVVDEQVKRELHVELVGGVPVGADVSPELAGKAQERHAYLVSESAQERARRLQGLKADAETLMNDGFGDE